LTDVSQVKLLEAEHKYLQDQIEELSKSGPRIQKLEEQIRILEEDRIKFEQYNNSMELKVKKYTDRAQFLAENIEKEEAELAQAEKEQQELQAIIDGRGMTIADIDRMANEKDRLDTAQQATSTRLEESKKRVAEKELAASRKLDELEQAIERYNNLGYQIGVIPANAANAKGQEYELVLTVTDSPNFSGSQMGGSSQDSSDRLLHDAAAGYSPHHLLNLDIRGRVRSNITVLRKEIAERRNAALEADMVNHDLLDKTKEAIDDMQVEVEALGHRVAQAEEELEKLREISNTQKSQSDAQIERMEKELGRMKSGLGESVQLMVQREMAVNIEYVASNMIIAQLLTATGTNNSSSAPTHYVRNFTLRLSVCLMILCASSCTSRRTSRTTSSSLLMKSSAAAKSRTCWLRARTRMRALLMRLNCS